MYRPQRESFVIQVRGGGGVVEGQAPVASSCSSSRVAPKNNNTINKFNNNFSSMKLFDRFRKIVMRFIFSIPSSRKSSSTSNVHRQKHHGDRPEPPKTSCSSYHYSPNSHYTEAIADCIEFFNRSSQEGSGCSDYGRKSDALV
ncbi:hypothetical protein BVC80_1831g125 [Macleaya cordata]|uniref:Uncharacterized protein n=1 Tax=Macleaya cordata TaxID=56857 RepID=A0A200R783_MACCD|nr:hypothetical protein BVC80_1831g125 [Macleaya cordata]